MTLTGGPKGKAVSFQVFPDKYLPFSNTSFTVTAHEPREYTWDTEATDGTYAFSIYSNDGFVRSFAGQVAPARKKKDGGLPRVEVDLLKGKGAERDAQVKLTLHNHGTEPLRYPLTAHDHLGGTQEATVAPGRVKAVTWPTRDGYYDVVVTVDTDTTLDAALRGQDRHGRKGLTGQDTLATAAGRGRRRPACSSCIPLRHPAAPTRCVSGSPVRRGPQCGCLLQHPTHEGTPGPWPGRQWCRPGPASGQRSSRRPP